MPRKRSEAKPADTGRTWSPLKGLTLIERGPRQVQARARRTGWPGQTRTFETVAAAEAWGVGILDGFNTHSFVDRRTANRTTLGAVLDRYRDEGMAALKGASQARSQIKQLRASALALRHVGEITAGDVLAWLKERRRATVRRKRRDEDGRTVRVKQGRRLLTQYDDVPVAEKTLLNELMRLSAAFVFARTTMGMAALKNPVEEVAAKDKPKRRERERRLRGGERERLLAACSDSRCAVLATIVELALETACRRNELVERLQWQDIDLERRTALLRDTKSVDGSYRERRIGLSARAVAILRGQGPKANGRVFAARADAVSRNFRRACERAGIADLNLHDQRSEAASVMAGDKGLDIVELAQQGGWRSLQVLKKYYRPRPEAIAAKLDR